MNIENGIFINNPIFEAPPPAFIEGVEASSKKKRTAADKTKARSWNQGINSQNPNRPTGPQRRETALNLGIIKRSQRRAKRPH